MRSWDWQIYATTVSFYDILIIMLRHLLNQACIKITHHFFQNQQCKYVLRVQVVVPPIWNYACVTNQASNIERQSTTRPLWWQIPSTPRPANCMVSTHIHIPTVHPLCTVEGFQHSSICFCNRRYSLLSFGGPNCIIRSLCHSPTQYGVMTRVELADKL